MPKTLAEIVTAARLNEPVTPDDLRYAVVAFDVLMSTLRVERHADQLVQYFAAAETPPRQYVGHANDPANPEAVAWYRSMISIRGGSANDEA